MRRQRHSAYTLVETVAVIGVIALILTAVSTTLHTMFRASQRVQDTNRQLHTLHRLRSRLTSDIHRATAVKEIDRGISITIDDDTLITYQLADAQFERLQTKVEAQDHRDVFRVPKKMSAKWELRPDDQQLVKLTLAMENDGSSTMPAFFDAEITVAIGLEANE